MKNPSHEPWLKSASGGVDDELVEVTPKFIRLRKRYLDSNERKRMEKQAAALSEG